MLRKNRRRVRMAKTTSTWVVIELDEPAGLKQRLAGTEQVQQSVEGQEIEDGTDRTEHQHEPLDQLDVPSDWAGRSLRIDPIERDGDL